MLSNEMFIREPNMFSRRPSSHPLTLYFFLCVYLCVQPCRHSRKLKELKKGQLSSLTNFTDYKTLTVTHPMPINGKFHNKLTLPTGNHFSHQTHEKLHVVPISLFTDFYASSWTCFLSVFLHINMHVHPHICIQSVCILGWQQGF